MSRPANGDGREVARALPNVPVHDCPWVGREEHLAAPNNPNRGRTWPLRVSPGPIKFAHCRESLGTRPSNCPVVRRVRGHNWLLSASGVLGHLIPICYPDARRGPDGKPPRPLTRVGAWVTETRPLQSVEVLTTGALVTPPIIGQQVATCDSLPGPLAIACCAWSR